MDKQQRAIAAALYLLVLLLVQAIWIGPGFPIDEKLLWLANGAAGLVLGSRLLHPHFTPPADVAANAFFAGATMVAALAAPTLTSNTEPLVWIALVACAVVFMGALAVLILKEQLEYQFNPRVVSVEHALRKIGQPRVVFTAVILALAWVFHSGNGVEVFAILATWTAIVALEPIEAVQKFLEWARTKRQERAIAYVGHVAAHQVPGLTLIRQDNEARHPMGKLLALSDPQGPTTLGVVLNYVGRDEGVLLRALALPAPAAIQDTLKANTHPASVAVEVSIDEEQKKHLDVLQRIQALCGIVDSGSTPEAIELEVVNDAGLSEGRLVNARVQSQRVIYQIIGGVTHEEAVQQKNKYGYIRAKARKIGVWDEHARKFKPVPWLPNINAPVFLEPPEEFVPEPESVGHFPKTNYQASVDVSDLVTHNTAILGILGIGKSFLAIELVERMIRSGVKVICLDLTDQYAQQLEHLFDAEYQQEADRKLREAGKGKTVSKSREQGGSILQFRNELERQISEFLAPDNEMKLRIINPANFLAWKQSTYENRGEAGFAALTPSEITALISDAALKASQSLGMTNTARVCLVYEEAHSLVPEWNSVASDGDQRASAASARAILQGRKFGLGCLLITQRTANVTKSILNQCNTIFAMRTFDDTGKEFLSNYIGRDYASILPTLQERHAVLFGKASSCDDPVLVRLNDRDVFNDLIAIEDNLEED
ncbi:MAG: DUF87 domain-containing protein [Filomicrobium sp.]